MIREMNKKSEETSSHISQEHSPRQKIARDILLVSYSLAATFTNIIESIRIISGGSGGSSSSNS